MSSSTFRKKKKKLDLSDAPFLTEKGIEMIKRYTTPRTFIGLGRYASYKDYGEDIWKIGYGSKKLKNRWVGAYDKASKAEIEEQLVQDLKQFSKEVAQYVHVPLNDSRKAAILSFAFTLGMPSFKECRLLNLINEMAPKSEIIREWSPYINTIWRSEGERMIDLRRVELDMYLAPDKEIPTYVEHKCKVKQCLLNLPETYTGAPTQIKAIEYLERKLNEFDPTGEVQRRFFRYWSEKPGGLGSPPRQGRTF
jgi:GH24 family phage-related lysozyme (muramidase)